MSTTTTTTPTRTELVDLAVRCCQIVAGGDLDAFRAIVHPEAVNREAQSEPPAARGRGPEAFYATALWLRTAFSDLAFTIDDVLVDADLTAVYCTMSGRHTGDLVIWNPEGEVERAFPPTGRAFAVQHAHFIRVRDGLAVEHWAVRDDQGMAMQLGWVPPSPAFLIRCAIATRRARKQSGRAGPGDRVRFRRVPGAAGPRPDAGGSRSRRASGGTRTAHA
jgi:predicted ester cyclase